MSQGRYIAYPFRGTTVRSAARLLNVVNDKMIFEITAFLALAIWCYVALGRGGFWRCPARDDGSPPPPKVWPGVTGFIPARDEAVVLLQLLPSLLPQHHPHSSSPLVVTNPHRYATPHIT